MSRSARIANYIERQFLTEEGAVRDNAEALFTADVAYHTAEETLTLEDIIVAAIAVCRSPRARRRIEATAFREQGDAVSWHISATLPGMADDASDCATAGSSPPTPCCAGTTDISPGTGPNRCLGPRAGHRHLSSSAN